MLSATPPKWRPPVSKYDADPPPPWAKNVLFIAVDDLRQQLAHTSPLEGEDISFMRTPHLDAFAREAVSFQVRSPSLEVEGRGIL